MIHRRGEGRPGLGTTPEDEEGPTGDDPWLDFFAAEDDEGPEPRPSFLGAVGQLAAAVLVVAALVALFIAGAVAFRWIFR